ncbi:MAG: DUF5000 domain-containing lipoprotein [Candidatus Saccharimonadaceae bacterium]
MKKIIFTLLFSILLFSCDQEPIGQQPKDNIPPSGVKNVQAESIAGGAILTYDLPGDEDLLYVKAVYSLRKGVISETKASLYKSTLTIEGFGDTEEREIKVVAVDRSQNESQPVIIKITPLEPVVISINNSLDLSEDFGGVLATWDNPNRAEVSVVLLRENENEEYVPIETFYSSIKNGSVSSRGMDTIPVNFGVFVQDRWENKSEIKYFTLTPLYETKFDRLKYKAVNLPGDQANVGGWEKDRMWNGVIGDEGYSSPGGSGIWPHSVTIDLGVLGKISRVRLFQRMGPYIFAEGNVRKFKIYGSAELDPSGDWDKWNLLMDCTSVKPSGLPLGQNSNEDVHVAGDGADFINSPMNPKVRYIRILVSQTWAGGDNFQISELEFYGDNRE